MSTQTVRRVLTVLSALVLTAGLAPPPAAGAAAPSGLSWPTLAAFPGALPTAPSSPDGLPTATQPGSTPDPNPGQELADVYSGFDDGLDDPDEESAPAVRSATPRGASKGPAGVAADVRAAVDSAGTVPVIIRLREQADLADVAREAAEAGQAAAAATNRQLRGAPFAAQAARNAAKDARGQVVVEALQAAAETSQDGIRALLERQDAEAVREYWVFNGFAATVDAATLDTLAGHPDVASVTLDETITLEEPIPAETGQPLLPSWSLEKVNAPAVWGEYGVRGAGVVVGVMDSGVDGSHPALAESWRGNDGDVEASWFPATGENYPLPGDGFGHGTHVAGSILGAPPGEVTGVAPDAEWIAAKIFRDNETTNTSIIHEGFEWMLAPGGDPANAPDVVNNSWGSDATLDTEYWDDVAAWEAAGIVPVFSNGNNGPGTGTVGSPASFPHAIGVGATDQADRLTWFSSRGPVTWDGVEYQKPEISAPGYQIRSAWPTDLISEGYRTISGTSMAAPHVTGAVALMLSAAPGLSVAEIREALTATARDESHMRAMPNGYGAGMVDAFAAVTHLTRTGLVTGVVTGPDGNPVPARVSAGGETTSADLTGRYALRLPGGAHELTITRYGFGSQTHPVTVSVGGTVTVDAALVAAAEHIVTGVVTGPDGPLPAGRVRVAGTPVPPSHTDPAGRFRLAVAAGSYQLEVAAGGHAPATVPVTVDGDRELSVSLDRLAGAADPGWSQYQNQPARTGHSEDSLAGETLRPDWTADVGGDVFFSSPVIADGRVFVNTDDGRLVALDLATGEQRWTFTGSPGMRGAPAVAGGLVYTGGGQDGGIHALAAATGELRWTVPTPGRRTIYTTPAIVDGVVYANTGFTQDRPDTIYALDPQTGAEIWSTDIGSRSFLGGAVAGGILVAASAGTNTLYGLDAATGEQRWTLERPGEDFVGAPSIAGGTAYVTTSVPPGLFELPFQGSLLAVDAATGELRWEVASHGDGQGTAPAVHGDLVIAGSHGLGLVGAYHRDTGEPAWHYGLEVTGGVSSSVLVSGDGYVVAGAQLDNRVFVLDAASGELVWEQPMGDSVLAAPAYAQGRLVVAEQDGTLRAFHPSGQVRGTVTGPDGPVPAIVRVPGTDHQTTADPATGQYQLSGLAPGEYTVEFVRFGFGTQTRTVRVLVAQAVTLDVALAPVAEGRVAGTVRDQNGTPLAGAIVRISPTPLEPVVTGPDGGYAFEAVAAGSYQVTVEAGGYVTADQPASVTAGETTTLDFDLARYHAAVVADFRDRVTEALTAGGLLVERLSFAEAASRVGDYPVMVLNGNLDDQADADLDRFAQLVSDADRAGTSLVVLGTSGVSFGSLRSLSLATGDPANHDWHSSTSQGAVWLIDPVAHPITASLGGGDGRTPLLTRGNHDWFSDYSGYTLATIGNDTDGELGAGIGYQPRTLTSSHILLASAAATTPSSAPVWEPTVRSLLVDAVRYAGSTRYGAVAGQVTGAAGDPLPATVEVVGGFQGTTAGADGQYRLLLEPGDYTLRVRSLGAQTVELPVTVAEGQTLPRDVTLPPLTLGVVAGQVTEEGTDEPLAGASVTVTGRPAVTTGPDGRYVVEDLAGGEYRLEVTADGYEPRIVEGVVVAEGEVTTVDVALPRAPGVVVVGDDDDQLTSFLQQHAIQVQQADGYEVTEALDGVEVVILNHTSDPGEEEFLAALEAFDRAGVSVIFPASGFSFRTRPVHLLSDYTGNPSDVEHIGGSVGDEIFLFQPADHPIFAGIEGDARLVGDRGDAATFPDYSGVALGQVGDSAEAPDGLGFAYDIRTPDSVHLLLSGLSASFRNQPNGNWTDQARQIFLNAVRWAADPGLGELTGTITDPAGEPIPFATVEVAGTSWQAPVDQAGSFSLGLPPGEHTLHIRAFGYVAQERTVTVAANQVVDVSTQLALGPVGTIGGMVSSQEGGGGIEPGEIGTTSLGGVSVILRGTPYRTVTGPDGSYAFQQIEPGRYNLELETEGHVRTLAEVEVAAGAHTVRDVAVRVSPLVGIIDDSNSSSTRDRGKEFLTDWGYQVEEIGWDSLDRIPELDLVVANRGNSSSSTDPGPDGLRAFLEAVNRAGVSVLWMDQNGRGAIRFLSEYDGDPAGRGQDSNDGAVVATVLEDHPLVAGLPDQFELLAPDGRYAWFEEFGGTTVASLTTDLGTLGGTIGYRGRTAGAVDVLLSTMSISTWGGPSTRQSPAHRWTPEAERVLVNALAWALEAGGIGAEVRGTVDSDRGGRIASQVTVLETGRTYQGRTGDGTFLVPLPAGTWTLQVDAFGHEPATIEVTVEAGQSLALPVTLTSVPTGTVAGTVRGPDGSPVAGAELRLLDTPLTASTGPDGGYTVDFVPGGDWTLRVTADGFRAAQVPVTVVNGQATPADVTLKATARVAFTDATGSSTHGTALANLIANEGYQVEVFHRSDLDQLAERVDEFDVVVFDAVLSFSSHVEEFQQAVLAAEAAGVSTIYGGQRGSWPLNRLVEIRGDPAEAIRDNTTEGIDYVASAPHPIFAGFPVGEPIRLVDSTRTNLNQRVLAYAGYSGTSIAHVHARVGGEDFGEAVGYRFTSPTSVEILLASLAASGTDGFPGEGWTENANRIYLNAVGWAVDATQSELTGVVTGAGAPLAGATVTAVEAGTSTVTGPDGSYQLGLAEGTHTIRVSAFGFAPMQEVVELPPSGTATLDVDLAPLPRGSVAGTVTSAAGGPVAGATVAGTGPVDWTATTGEDGRYAAGDLLEGEYEVTVSADGFLPATATVTVIAGGAVALDVTLQPTDVGVLGDAGGSLTAYLREAGVPAAELTWDAELDLTGYQVVVVNGGSPDAATFQAVLAAADAAQTSLVFTGTWAVDRGGIRLLERYTDRVAVGAQGFGDGPVQLTGFDPEHPVFAGLGADPATLIVEGGYYSVLDSYVGQPLAGLRVARDGAEPVTGLAAGWDWRTAGSVELLLSASAATEAVGPGLGWTPEGGQLVVDAIAWARDRVLAPPGVPTLEVAAPVVLTETVTVRGTADWPSQVTVHRDGQPVATVDTGLDGRWSAEVPLLVGDNQLTVAASNLAGGSPVSAPVTVSRWAAEWQVRGHWPVHVVTLAIDGPTRWTDPANKAELVVLDPDGNEVRRAELQWVVGFYLHVLRGLPPGDYTLQAELVVDGQLLVIDGPELS